MTSCLNIDNGTESICVQTCQTKTTSYQLRQIQMQSV